jgi:hypothetical protein
MQSELGQPKRIPSLVHPKGTHSVGSAKENTILHLVSIRESHYTLSPYQCFPLCIVPAAENQILHWVSLGYSHSGLGQPSLKESSSAVGPPKRITLCIGSA